MPAMRKIIGIIGYPLEHSLSPVMHNAAFRKLNLNYEYVAFEVAPPDLKEALSGLRALKICGINVTIPHKETIIPLLDDLTKVARDIGAVNTVICLNQKLTGYNTDGPGLIESLKEDAKFDPVGKKVVILGAGGAGRAAATMLGERGAKSIAISDIAENKAANLVEYLLSYSKAPCQEVKMGSAELQEKITAADLLLNATPVGMYPKSEETALPENIQLPSHLLVYDLVYNPRETKLLKAARAAGAQTCSGLGMLVRQGALAFTLFTGEEAPLETMRQAVEEALDSR
jgi:shikimate dehydrogenase